VGERQEQEVRVVAREQAASHQHLGSEDELIVGVITPLGAPVVPLV